MSNKSQLFEERQYNSSMYLARLFFKHPAAKVCAVLLCLYLLTVIPLSIVVFLAEAQFITAILLLAGSGLMTVGAVIAILASKEGGALYDMSFMLMIGGAAAFICEKLYSLILFRSLETVLHIVFLIVLIMLILTLRSASRGQEPKIYWGYLYALSGFAAAGFSVIMLITCIGFFQACYAGTYDWDFLSETVGTESAKSVENYSYMFLGANVASKFTKVILFTRTAERIAAVVLVFLTSAIMLKLTPYLNGEKKRVDFASEAGGFETFDGDSFRSIYKRQVAVNSNSFGMFAPENDDDHNAFEDDFSPEPDEEKPETNEYGDYFDEKDGIYYYFDAQTERYYYVDKATGVCRYKEETRRPKPPRQNKVAASVTGETMPWEEESDEEDNIFNY